MPHHPHEHPTQAHGHTIDYDHWHQHVHGTLPYELVAHNEPLRALLSQIKLPLYVFTNADDKHAAICLQRMGIADLFRDVITFERIQAMGKQRGKVHHGVPVVCKPARMAFELALQAAGGAHAHTTVFFDDSARNVASAASMGIYSVLVCRDDVDGLVHQSPSMYITNTAGGSCGCQQWRGCRGFITA